MKKKILILFLMLFTLSGCTKRFNVVINEEKNLSVRKLRKKPLTERKQDAIMTLPLRGAFFSREKSVDAWGRYGRSSGPQILLQEVPICELKLPWRAVSASRETTTRKRTKRMIRIVSSWTSTAVSAGSIRSIRKQSKAFCPYSVSVGGDGALRCGQSVILAAEKE